MDEYDPLNYDNLAASVVGELMRRGPWNLPLTKSFAGAGVYALFFDGPLECYHSIRCSDASMPIYVGKAVPEGARKGSGSGGETSGKHLFTRINDHVKSIDSARNLDVGDFRCRYLVVKPVWITLAERFLVERYKPVWNVCVEGFGLHDPGRGRHQGEISWWDALHPGRRFASRLRQTRTEDDAKEHLRAFFDSRSW